MGLDKEARGRSLKDLPGMSCKGIWLYLVRNGKPFRHFKWRSVKILV